MISCWRDWFQLGSSTESKILNILPVRNNFCRYWLWDPMAHLMMDLNHGSGSGLDPVVDPYGVSPVWPTLWLPKNPGAWTPMCVYTHIDYVLFCGTRWATRCQIWNLNLEGGPWTTLEILVPSAVGPSFPIIQSLQLYEAWDRWELSTI